MKTKKELNSRSKELKTVIGLWEKGDWNRYQEFPYTKNGYHRKLIFSYPNKVKIEVEINKKDYLLWRDILENKFR